MECSRCGTHNREGAQFCRNCGAQLIQTCPNCGAGTEPGSRFCDSCGAALITASAAPPARFASPHAYTPKHLVQRILTSKTALEGERKQVTVLFADLKGSMELLADRDPEEARRLLDPVLERMIDAVHRYEGTVNQVLGDGIMALFGAPLAHEDHAVRACYAALRIQESIKGYADEVRRTSGVPISVRVGLNSGEVVVRSIGSDLHMDYTAIGQTTHLAARMEQMAMPGSIVVAPSTFQLAEGYVDVQPLGPAHVKGLSEAVEVYELAGARAVRSRFHATAERGLTRFVGRETETEQLRQALGRAAVGQGRVAALVGEPGVGKSRLVWEFTRSHRTHGWLVLEASSVSYGKATPYLPVIDLLKSYCKIQDRDDQRAIREKLTGKILTLDRTLEPTLPAFLTLFELPVEDAAWQALEPRQRRRRTLDAIKRLLLRESQVQPVLLVFEDLHWIDTEAQALLDSLVESLPTARMLLLVNYRPEYQHGWGSKTYYSQIRLDPLPRESAEELLKSLLGGDPSFGPLTAQLIRQTDGNPFFLEESVWTLVETKALTGERGAYRLAKHVETIQVPPTVQSMLAARIDRLPPDDKRLLQTAAIIGKDIPFPVLQAIAELPDAELRDGLARLQAAEFLYETSLFPDLEYTFKHALTHEVSYGSLLQERRSELHRRAGEALERLFPDRAEEQYGILARHFTESGEFTKGMEYSILAAQKAETLFAHEEALRYYERARSIAETLNQPEKLASIEEATGGVHLRHGHLEQAIETYERSLRLAPIREQQAVLKFKIGRVYGQFGGRRGLEFLQAALEELNPETQRNELAHAMAMVGRYHHYAAQHGRALEFLDRAVRLAEPGDDADTLATIYGYFAGAYQHLARFQESILWARRCIDLGERKQYLTALRTGYAFLSEDASWAGHWEDGVAYAIRAGEVARRADAHNFVAWAEHDRAKALQGRGQLAETVAAARAALSGAKAAGDRRLAVWARTILGQTGADLGDDEAARAEAQAAIEEADALGDRVQRAFSRYVLSYFHLQRGEWERAAALSNDWREILAGTDNRVVLLLGGAYAAEAVWRVGRIDEAVGMLVEHSHLAREAGSLYSEALARRVQG